MAALGRRQPRSERVENGHSFTYAHTMTPGELERLRGRIMTGESMTSELWTLRKTALETDISDGTAEALSDLWNLAFHREGLFPKIEAAKALVEAALATNSSYPILTNDGLIYDSLSPVDRQELVRFILNRISGAKPAIAKQVLLNFVDDLRGNGPQV